MVGRAREEEEEEEEEEEGRLPGVGVVMMKRSDWLLGRSWLKSWRCKKKRLVERKKGRLAMVVPVIGEEMGRWRRLCCSCSQWFWGCGG